MIIEKVSQWREEALMGDENKTRVELINESEELRHQDRQLKSAEVERQNTEVPQTPEERTEKVDGSIEPDSSLLVDGKYSITDLVDIEDLRRICDQFSQATGFTTGLVSYPAQEVLIATGWRDVCTKFHRTHPESAKHCKNSNIHLTQQLKELKEWGCPDVSTTYYI